MIFVSLLWWFYYFYRLIQASQNQNLREIRTLYLWFNAFLIGLDFMLADFPIEAGLNKNLFSFTDFPAVSIIKATLFLGTPYLYLIAIRVFSPVGATISKRVDAMMITGYVIVVAINIRMYLERATYSQIQWATLVILSIALALFAMSILPMSRRILQVEYGHIELSQYFFFIAFMVFMGFGSLLYFISALQVGFFKSVSIYHAVENLIAITSVMTLSCLAMLITPNHKPVTFPFRLITYLRLRRLVRHVLNAGDVEQAIEPTPVNLFVTFDLELATYQAVIAILDYYPYLKGKSSLYDRLQDIENQHTEYHKLVNKLIRVSLSPEK